LEQTMKVDGNRPEQLANASQPGSAAQAAQAAERLQQQQRLDQQQRAAEGRSDRVELSADARLADSAVRAATRAPEIRQDVVERVRAELEAGELGKDLFRLADKMIDNLLSR
jgi:flagellar biosynthesis anti-sigma factor FlgM